MEDLEAGKRPKLVDQVPSGTTTPDPTKEEKKKDKVSNILAMRQATKVSGHM